MKGREQEKRHLTTAPDATTDEKNKCGGKRKTTEQEEKTEHVAAGRTQAGLNVAKGLRMLQTRRIRIRTNVCERKPAESSRTSKGLRNDIN